MCTARRSGGYNARAVFGKQAVRAFVRRLCWVLNVYGCAPDGRRLLGGRRIQKAGQETPGPA